MDTSHTSHTSTTCMVRVDEQLWRNSEVSLGTRSLLVRAVDGSAPVEWLPYDDVADVAEVDGAGFAAGFIDVTARDGRHIAMQLDPEMLTSLLAALSDASGREEAAPRPAEFGIGAAAVQPSAFTTTPSAEAAEVPTPAAPPDSTAPPPNSPVEQQTEPAGSSPQRKWVLFGVLVILALAAIGLFALLGGSDSGREQTSTPPTTDSPDIDATPDSDVEVQTTTTVPTEPVEDGPESAVSVSVDDVVIDTGGESPAVYLAFATTNETSRNVSAYDVEVQLLATDPQGQDLTWPVQFRCASSLVAEGTRTGSFTEQAPGADLDALVDCRVGAWPIDNEDQAQSAFTAALASGATWNAEVTVVTVEFTDGTVLE